MSPVLPVRRPALARLLAEIASGLVAATGGPLRLGVDGLGPDTRAVADELADALGSAGLEALRVSTSLFLRPRSLRLEWGLPEAEDLLTSWFDDEALVREVLRPLGPDGDRHWVDGLRDPLTDRSLRRPTRLAGPQPVAVLDGPLLGRAGLAGHLDLIVRLQTGPAALRRRLQELGEDAVPGGVGGDAVAQAVQALDLRPAHPRIVVRFDHGDRPAVELPGGADQARPPCDVDGAAARILAGLSASPAPPSGSGRRTTAR